MTDDGVLVPREVGPLRGVERFDGIEATVGDFWSWAFSDLRSNAVRGVLAEYLVGRAVGATEPLRNPWDHFDVLSPDRVRIEVKASAYLQNWPQRRHSQCRHRLGQGQLWRTAFVRPTGRRHFVRSGQATRGPQG